MIEITVGDTGSGIPEENLNRIFDPFFTTKGALGGGRQEGTGLGLSVCYNIIQSRGGRITVESAPGMGTPFSITLPVSEQAAGGAAPAVSGNPDALENREGNHRILVIDDEEQIRQMLSDFLGTDNVVCRSTGEEAIEVCRTQDFDFIILDVCMKNSSDGIDTFRRLKQADPRSRIILCTGNLAESMPEEILESCHAHLLKPFKLDDLSTILNLAVEA